MKIIAVGMNYAEHNKELHGSFNKTESPVIFCKPDSALLRDGRPFFLPDFITRCDYETELVVRICRLGKSIATRFAHRYYDSITVGIDFTNRTLQEQLRKEGLPWDLCKGFDGSAVIGDFISLEGINVSSIHFRLDIDGKTVQKGFSGDMLYSIDEIISYVSRFYTLKQGDIIFTGTPVGVGPVAVNQHLEGYIEQQKLLDFNIK